MEIIIKEQVEKPKSTYVLNMEYMHGDGDATTCKEFEFKDLGSLIKVLEIIIEAKETYNPDRYYDGIKKRNLKMNDWWEYFETDATTLDGCAAIQDFYVVYFDENEIEYTTEIKK